ncbi:DUF2815 family protein [Oscillospiraceae bacterium OttesenSCG-928-G22]|nr:DUF2815 family protein [Oscillospiraceae bacterium OttesenSCG-928-G22]
MYQNIPTKVLTGEVRLSYANLTAPRAAQQGGDAKYGVTLLIPKTDTATYQDIVNSIEAAAQDAQGKLWNGVRPPVLPQPLHDGDGVRESGVPYGPECKGCWVITASSKNKPQVVHQSNVGVELAPQDIYSGMYARVTINFFGYNSNGKKGVGCGLGNVMKTQDGEPLAGGASAEADFAGVGTPAGAAPAYGGVPAGAAPIPQTYAAAPGTGAINPLTGLPM